MDRGLRSHTGHNAVTREFTPHDAVTREFTDRPDHRLCGALRGSAGHAAGLKSASDLDLRGCGAISGKTKRDMYIGVRMCDLPQVDVMRGGDPPLYIYI